MEYERLFENLHKADIRYLICGGLAVNIYGIPRMTADIDLFLDFEIFNLKKFEAVLKDLSYTPMIPVPISQFSEASKRLELEKEKNLIAYSFYNSMSNYMNVDVLMKCPLSFEEMWLDKEVRKVSGYSVNLASIKDLIEMKKFANRKQDRDDVILLTKLLPKK